MTTTTTVEGNVRSKAADSNPRPRVPRLALYHPTGGGVGAAMQLELRLNRLGEQRYDCFFLDLAAQKTAAGRDGDKREWATFDWERKLTVKLDFADVCELLAVLEGKAERAGGQRNGLYHENGNCSTVIGFQKSPERNGYLLGLSRKDKGGGQVTRIQMGLSETEAIGLRCLFQTGLFFMTFGQALHVGGVAGVREPAA